MSNVVEVGVGEKENISWVGIIVEGRPTDITMKIAVNAPVYGLVLAINYGGVKELTTDGYILNVGVTWNGPTPSTRKRYNDNIDIIFLQSDGAFTDIQVGLVTREKRFFVTTQQVYKGWITRTRGSKPGEVKWEFTPSDPIHAYPGCGYKSIWPDMTGELLIRAQNVGANLQRSRVKPAQWTPPDVPPKPGWRAGVVRYFNMVTGTGVIEDSKGSPYFVHFSTILDKDGKPMQPFPFLEPMTGVYFRPHNSTAGEKGPSQGPPVKSVMPA